MSTLGAVGFTAVVSAELVAAALLCSLTLRPRSPVCWLLVGYVVLLAETSALTNALSPFRLVDRAGIASLATAFLVASAVAWLRLGGYRVPRADTRLRLGVAEWLLVAAVSASVLYQLTLGLTMPPNNWDSLTYHLSRTAAWVQHRGVYWIPDAPTDRMNEFQPVAEQQILVLFVAMGRASLFAFPQWLAELALVGAVYETARQIGHSAREAIFAALLFATFPLVALEGTTAQNDLVAAAPAAVAVALILGGTTVELMVAGVALGLALGVKLTTLFVVPLVLVLALTRGRRVLAVVAFSGTAGFLLFSSWSFVLNLIHTGSLLGQGRDRITQQASPSLVGSPTTLFRIVYDLFDLSGLSLTLIDTLAVAGAVLAVALLVVALRRGQPARAIAVAVTPALPFLVPRLVPFAAHATKIAAQAVHLPVENPSTTGGVFLWGIDSRVGEDFSAFGAIGGPLLFLGALWLLFRRDGLVAQRLLAGALPLFLVLLSLTSKYNPWLARFLLVPTALAVPLMAIVARQRALAAAIACVAVIQLSLVHVHNEQKPLTSSAGRPWGLTQAGVLRDTFRPEYAQAPIELSRLVPSGACLGAAVGRDDPSFLLYGSRFQRRVRYLPIQDAADAARAAGLRFVVFGTDVPAASFQRGWTLHPLTTGRPALWTLAVSRVPGCG